MHYIDQMKIEIKEITYGSAEYAAEIALRRKILRVPLGLEFTSDELAADTHDRHIGAFRDGELAGCLILSAVDAKIAKMRQVAVDESLQGTGVGRLLVEACEAKARAAGATEIQLNARESAVSFYLKLGYAVTAGPFTEVTVPHFKMSKRL
jgi:predicted GNAT family N-acyltransferase